MVGTITKYVGPKSYGFITTDDNKTYFFHKDDFKSSTAHIAKTNIVEFDVDETDKTNPRAVNIIKIGLGEKNPYVNMLDRIETYIKENISESEEREFRLRDLNKTRNYIVQLRDIPV